MHGLMNRPHVHQVIGREVIGQSFKNSAVRLKCDDKAAWSDDARHDVRHVADIRPDIESYVVGSEVISYG